MAAREIFGYVYELVLGGQPEHVHEYVGKTTGTIHQRVHGPRGHKSAAEVERYPWKADILPGRAGYRKLETVYVTGEGRQADERALARAEAYWIDQLRPVRNKVRPVQPRVEPRAATPRKQAPPVRTSMSARGWLTIAAAVAATYLAARVVLAMHLPWPAAPWIAAPAAGVGAGIWTSAQLQRAGRHARRALGIRRR